LRRFRGPTEEEIRLAERVLVALRQRDDQATGQLFRRVGGENGLARRSFEDILEGLVVAGLVTVEDDTFDKGGRVISFQRAHITRRGRGKGIDIVGSIKLSAVPEPAKSPRAKKSTDQRRGNISSDRPADSEPSAADPELVEALKAWRRAEAMRNNVPAFCICNDRTLRALAAARPADQAGLLAVAGIGPTLAGRYGKALLRLLKSK
jgi:superfamily II DNA helicase RecQ